MQVQTTFKKDTPILYLVATPIGNLDDMSLRAIEVLKAVDFIYAEDTRTSQKLMQYHQILTPLKSFHEHNEEAKANDVIRRLTAGRNVALISDAGSPLISDPGESLVKKVREKGYSVSAIPGPTAVITALIASNLMTAPFTFIGFLPQKEKAKQDTIKQYMAAPETLIFYESPHRIHKTLQAMYEILGDREICIARELTKIYETFIHMRLSEHENLPPLKGEIVLIVEGAPKQETLSPHDMIEHVALLIADGESEMQAIKTVAKLRQLKKNTVYMAYQNHKKHKS